jgi:hypothetical protein
VSEGFASSSNKLLFIKKKKQKTKQKKLIVDLLPVWDPVVVCVWTKKGANMLLKNLNLGTFGN